MVDRWGVETDPAGRWTDAASLLHARYGHAAMLLHDGRVLVRGGFSVDHDDGTRFGTERKVAHDEVWDPESGLWRDIPPAMADELAHGAVAAPAPGAVRFPHAATEEMIERDGRTVRRDAGAIVAVNGGTLIAAGFTTHLYADSSQPSESLETITLLFRPDARFQIAGEIRTRRMLPAAVRLSDGRVLLTGGCNEMMRRLVFDAVEIWEPR